jgi:hypothetical protein
MQHNDFRKISPIHPDDVSMLQARVDHRRQQALLEYTVWATGLVLNAL